MSTALSLQIHIRTDQFLEMYECLVKLLDKRNISPTNYYFCVYKTLRRLPVYVNVGDKYYAEAQFVQFHDEPADETLGKNNLFEGTLADYYAAYFKPLTNTECVIVNVNGKQYVAPVEYVYVEMNDFMREYFRGVSQPQETALDKLTHLTEQEGFRKSYFNCTIL